MKTMDSLLALSVLTTLVNGTVNAATVATYDVAVMPLDIIYHAPEIYDEDTGVTTPAQEMSIMDPSSLGGIGSAVLDDAGTLTITSAYNVATILGTNTTFGTVVTVQGSWLDGLFTAASASFHYTSCLDSGYIVCDRVPFNFEVPFTGVVGSVSTLDGSFTTTWSTVTSNQHVQYVLSNGTPTVPVPAAAWLFGSGLLGLFGAARRRPA